MSWLWSSTATSTATPTPTAAPLSIVDHKEDNACISHKANEILGEDAGAENEELAEENDSKNKNNSKAPSSWNEALLSFCKEKKTLAASPRQVLEKLEGHEIHWRLPTKNETVTVDSLLNMTTNPDSVAMNSILLQWRKTKGLTLDNNVTSQSLVGRMFRGATSTLYTAVVNTIWHDDELMVPSDWQEEGDNVFLQHGDGSVKSANNNSNINMEEAVISVDLVIECLNILQEQLASETVIITRRKGSKQPTWLAWCRQCSNNSNSNNNKNDVAPLTSDGDIILSNISSSDADILLSILIAANLATLSKRSEYELVVLGGHGMEKSQKDSRVALFEVDQAQQSTEAQIQTWTKQIEECGKKALQHKRQGQTSLAMTQLKKRALIKERLESTQSLILQLEQVRGALELAQHNKHVFETLASTTTALREVRADTNIDDIDTMQDDLQSELDHLEDINNSIAKASFNDVDEDELLSELNKLSLLDSTTNTTDPSTTSNDGTVGKDSNTANNDNNSMGANNDPMEQSNVGEQQTKIPDRDAKVALSS